MSDAHPEDAWAGKFGDEYHARQVENRAGRRELVRSILGAFPFSPYPKIVEFGAGRGLNLAEMRYFFSEVHLSAVEINANCRESLEKVADSVHIESAVDGHTMFDADLAMTCGMLIHIDTPELPKMYHRLYHAAPRLAICEYYSPEPRQISYRDNVPCIARDFAGEMMRYYPNLQLERYGFMSRHDPNFPMDDITWFVLNRKGPIYPRS